MRLHEKQRDAGGRSFLVRHPWPFEGACYESIILSVGRRSGPGFICLIGRSSSLQAAAHALPQIARLRGSCRSVQFGLRSSARFELQHLLGDGHPGTDHHLWRLLNRMRHRDERWIYQWLLDGLCNKRVRERRMCSWDDGHPELGKFADTREHHQRSSSSV